MQFKIESGDGTPGCGTIDDTCGGNPGCNMDSGTCSCGPYQIKEPYFTDCSEMGGLPINGL